MPERQLTASLASTFAALDDLVRRDQDAAAHAEAQERVTFLLTHLQKLQAAIRRLKAAAALLSAIDPDSRLTTLWSQTRKELRTGMPSSFRTPGRAIVAGHLDLLRLVEYTAASVTTAQERCREIVDTIVHCLASHVDMRPGPAGEPIASSSADQLRQMVEETVDQLVTEGSQGDAVRICRQAGWLLAETGDEGRSRTPDS